MNAPGRESKKSRDYLRGKNNLVGRFEEINRLSALLENTKDGKGKFVLLNGEAGIGKSALAEYICQQAGSDSFMTRIVRFQNSSVNSPYKPFIDLVSGFSKTTNQKLKYYESIVQNEYSKKNDSPIQDQDKNFETFYTLQNSFGLIQQSLSTSIIAQSHQKPLFILLEDLCFATQTVWQFLHYLTGKIVENPIFLLGTLRQDGNGLKPEQIPVYADVIQRMNREGLLTKLQLCRLSREDVRTYLSRRYQKSDLSSEFVSYVNDICSGIPEKLVSYTDILEENGAIFRRDGIWFNKYDISREKIAKLIIKSHDMKSVVEEVNNLHEDQIAMLRYFALLSRHIDHHLMTSLIKKSKVQIIKDLIYLTDKKYLLKIDKNSFQIKYESLGNELIERMTRAEKKTLSLTLADTIQNAKGIDEKEKIYLLARVYSLAKKNDEALRYLTLAGNIALHSLAISESREFYLQSLNIIKSSKKKTDKKQLILIHLRLAWVERILGNWKESLRNSETALKYVSNDKNDTLLNSILLQQGLTYFRLRNWKKAIYCFSNCLGKKKHGTSFSDAMCLYGMGSVYFESGEHERSLRYFKLALGAAKRLDRISLQAKILNNLGAVESLTGKHMLAVKYYSQSLPLYKNIGDNYGLAQVYNNLGLTYAEGEKWQEADKCYSKALQLCDNIGIAPLKIIIFLNRVFALIQLEKIEEAEEYNKKALNLLRRSKDELSLAEYYKNMGIIHRKKYHYVKAAKSLESARKKFKSLNNMLGCAESEYERALLAADLQDKNEIEIWLDRAVASFRQLGLEKKVRKIDSKREELIPSINLNA